MRTRPLSSNHDATAAIAAGTAPPDNGAAEPSAPTGGSKPDAGQPPGAAASERPRPGLYLVATPIGNLGDVTLRALETLRAVDLIACEDTRVSVKLLARHRIATPLIAYYDHNAAKVRPELLQRLRAGQRIALIADAGTPMISDPGYKLVHAALAQGTYVTALPGPSAVLAALCLAGLPTDRFLFAGFLPAKGGQRKAELRRLAAVDATLVLLESPQRLAAALADMAAVLGAARPAGVARELTKVFEEVRRGALGELAAHYAASAPPKGEVVVVVGPPEHESVADDKVTAALRLALRSLSVKDAAALVAGLTGAPRRTVYDQALTLSHGRANDR